MPNLYATLSDYKEYSTGRGQNASMDTTDDGVILDLIEQASRYLEDKTTRRFYPSIETRLYDTPNSSELLLDEDLLEVLTLTNGDATTITTTNYKVNPANNTPVYSLSLKDISSVSWQANSSNSSQQVISVRAVWGYRKNYSVRAWKSVGTLGAAITDTTTLAFTMTTGHTIVPYQILKIDSEIYNVASVSTNTITPIQRGDNGSTAATHSNGATVYMWMPEEGAYGSVLEIANTAYQRRFGKSTGESATITGAGVVLTPRDIPKMAEEFIRTHMRYV